MAGNIEYRKGDFYHGTKQTVRLEATYRPNYRLTSSLSYQLNDIELPLQGAFMIHLVGVKMKYVHINAPKEQVWDILADLGGVKYYNPSVTESY